jgi:15-cis-phytoene desaturase
MEPERVLDLVCADAQRLGLTLAGHVTDYRLVTFAADFNSLEPGHMAKRPTQATPVAGLTLAGDYTRQRFVATMEGAVVSGRKAEAVLGRSL